MVQDTDEMKKEWKEVMRKKDLIKKHILSLSWNECVDDEMLSDDEDSTSSALEEFNPPGKCMDPQSSRTNNGNGFSSDSEDSTNQISQELRPPDKFICPLTKQVMSDPVILSSGKTVERKFIEAFFAICPTCQRCPVTKREIFWPHELIPDDALRTEIERCQENKAINDERRDYFRMLLKRLAYSGEDQLAAAAELRALVHDFPSYAEVFYYIGPSAVLELARPLLSQDQEHDTLEPLREDLIVTFRLLAKHKKKIRRFFTDHCDVVNLIAESLISGSLETRRSAVTLLYYITAVPGGRQVLNQLGVAEHLVKLVEEGDDLVLLNDAILSLFRLNLHSQRVIDGILSSLLRNLDSENKICNLECILNTVMKDAVIWKHVAEADVLYHELLGILKDSKSDAVKAFSVATLLCIVQSSDSALMATRICEEEYNVVTQIMEEGTPQAKENAAALHCLLAANKPNQTAATEIHQIELDSVDVMGAHKPDHMAAAEVHHNELKSADAMDTHTVDHTEEATEIHHDELLDLLQETECGDVMEIWADALLRLVERNEAALIATWKREKKSQVITRVQILGNAKAWHTADKIFEWLDTVHRRPEIK